MKTYKAIITEMPDGSFDVDFPDVPGCFTYGYSLTEAIDNAKEILELWLNITVVVGSIVSADTHQQSVQLKAA